MTDALTRFSDLVGKLQGTSSRLEKESILKSYTNDPEILDILKFLFNPYIVTGISDKKLGKNFDLPPLLAMATDHVHQAEEGVPLCNRGVASPQAMTGCCLSIIDYFKLHNTGRDEDVKFLRNSAQKTAHPDLVYAIIKRDLKLGVQNTTLNKVFGPGFVPKFDVMLAERYVDNREYVADKPFIITEKLDGVRCVLVFDPSPAFFSRAGQPVLDLVEITPEVAALDPNYVYDGEMLLDTKQKMPSDELYRLTVRATQSDGPKRDLIFNIFDMVDKSKFQEGEDPTPCIDRKARLAKLLAKIKKPHLKNVEILYSGPDIAQIEHFRNEAERLGMEGVMLNISAAPYQCKRTKNLMKVKVFNTADVLVLDLEEGSAANRGKLGAAVVQFMGPDGKKHTCRVGSGFKFDEREKFWADPTLIKGKIIEINYFELSRNQNDENYSMRFPTFKCVRLDKTEISMY